MARPTAKTINFFRGDSYPVTITLRDKATGQPLPLNGATFTLSVDARAEPDDASTLQFALTGVVSEPASGRVVFTPSAADNGTVGGYYYDVEMVDAAGNVRTVAKDQWVINMDITK